MERLEQQKHLRAKKAAGGDNSPPAAKPSTIVPAVGGAINTGDLALLLNIKRHTLNARIRRAGGVGPGLTIEGLGLALA